MNSFTTLITIKNLEREVAQLRAENKERLTDAVRLRANVENLRERAIELETKVSDSERETRSIRAQYKFKTQDMEKRIRELEISKHFDTRGYEAWLRSYGKERRNVNA